MYTFPVLDDQLLSLIALLGKVVETNPPGRAARTGRHLVIVGAREMSHVGRCIRIRSLTFDWLIGY